MITKKKAETVVADYLNIEKDIKELKDKQKKMFETVITPFADEHTGEFENSKLELVSGVLQYKKSPPKLLDGEDNSLKATEREMFCDLLPSAYVKKSPDVTSIMKKLNSDNLLKSIIDKSEIQVTQDVKLTVVKL